MGLNKIVKIKHYFPNQSYLIKIIGKIFFDSTYIFIYIYIKKILFSSKV